MKRGTLTAVAMTGVFLGAAVTAAQETQRDRVVYVDKYKDPVLEEMGKANEARAEAVAQKTDEVLAAHRGIGKKREEERRTLRFDVSGISKPAGPEAFSTRVWHLPPQAQYLTGSCWSFSTTSFLESEVHRLTAQEVKLSEMWFVYWEWVAKAQGWVASRGQTVFEEGSQSAAVVKVMRERGVVPLSAYPGVVAADGRHDHEDMHRSMQELLHWCRDTDFWDEEVIVGMIRRILDRTMGPPPEVVESHVGAMTPNAYMSEALRLDPDAFVDLMSTLSVPFWSRGEYRVPDNWWHGGDYVNIPLDDWYAVIGRALGSGYSLVIGGDVSEPGLYGFEDIAVVPTFDIPGDHVDQHSREYRFDNGSTADDHGIHLVGHTLAGDHDWFLVKDSGRSSRWGKYEGYYMYRDDFVRLKMLTLTVHRDVVADILARVDGPR